MWYRTIHILVDDLEVKVTDLEFLCISFTMPVFAKMDLIRVGHGDSYWSKILRGTIHTRVHDLRSRSQTFFYVKVLQLSFYTVRFCKACNGFWWLTQSITSNLMKAPA